jgi:hypothetical protein
MTATFDMALSLVSAHGATGREGCTRALVATDVDREELVLTLAALAHELATFAGAGYRESPQEILQMIGRSMTRAERGSTGEE